MSKPLHDCVLVFKDGKEPQRYDRDSIDFLIDGANCYIEEGETGPASKIALSKSFLNLMSEYEKNGPSNALIDVLTKFLEPVRHQCILGRRNGKLVTVYVAHLAHKPDPGVLACYLFSSMTSLGWLDGLKRCKSLDCKKFFIGKSNRSWCSSTCGSRARVKKMRKKNNKYEV